MVKSNQSVLPVESQSGVAFDVGKSFVIKGELSAAEDLTLTGQMEGRVTVPDHTLTIGPHARITADVSARVVVILGTVKGNMTAADKIEIRATGNVIGDLTAPRLALEQGGCLQGRVAIPKADGK